MIPAPDIDTKGSANGSQSPLLNILLDNHMPSNKALDIVTSSYKLHKLSIVKDVTTINLHIHSSLS